MITKRTVFVLGAGASFPYGFPLGKKLVSLIENAVNNQKVLACYCEAQRREHGRYNWTEINGLAQAFRNDLIRGNPDSIDEYLERRQIYLRLGKIAISSIIHEYSLEFINNLNVAISNGTDWMNQIKKKILEKKFENTCKNEIAFVTFNYDMSLERYLYNVLTSNYPESNVMEFFNKVKIFHVHGRIHRFPSEQLQIPSMLVNKPVGEHTRRQSIFPIENGELCIDENELSDILNMSDDLRLFYEEQDKKLLGLLEGQMIMADQVVFLGFGFHPDNIVKFGVTALSGGINQRPKIFSTRYDLTDSEWTAIKNKNKFKQFIKEGKEKDDCFTFLRNIDEYLT